MRKTLLTTLFLFLALTAFVQPVHADWLDYAVVMRTTGSDDKDRQIIFNFRKRLARLALTYIGTPYVFGANGPKAFDCSGFVKDLYRRMGIRLPRTAYEQGYAGAPIRLSLRNLKIGDLIYFRRDRRGGWPHHVGMYLWRGMFIHCTKHRGVVVDNLLTSNLTRTIKSVSRIFLTKREELILRQMNRRGQ